MSYILDALRKSEQQRKLMRDLKLAQSADEAAAQTPRRGWPIALVVLTTLGAGIGAYLALQADAPSRASAPEPVATAPAPAVPPSVATQSTARDTSGAPIGDLAGQTRALRPATTATSAPRSTDEQPVPFLREMAADFARSVPVLVVNIHVYSPDPAQRVLYINNKAVREGEAVADNIYVENITADGVVLQRLGTRFKLPRPQ